MIVDPGLARRITVQKKGGLSTAIWSPWAQTVAHINDLGADGWKDMVCVESANVLGNSVRVEANASHVMSVTYSAETI